MKQALRDRLKAEWEAIRDRPHKKPSDLLNHGLSTAGYLDAAVLGGVEIRDVIAGRIGDHAIPPGVEQAFHAQYPGLSGSFAGAVHRLSGDPDALRGLVAGVKGKLFEEQYVDWLNHGQLPGGLHATLAHAANNPGWDVAIEDAHGHVDQVLQLKATDQLGHLEHAIALHPNIDVVVPHDVYAHLAQHADLAGHLADSAQSYAHLTSGVHTAAAHAELAGHGDFALPYLGILFAIGHSFYQYRTGQLSSAEALQSGVERSGLAIFAEGAFHAAILAAHGTFLPAVPVSIGARLLGGQALHNHRRRRQLEAALAHARSACDSLRAAIERRPAFS